MFGIPKSLIIRSLRYGGKFCGGNTQLSPLYEIVDEDHSKCDCWTYTTGKSPNDRHRDGHSTNKFA